MNPAPAVLETLDLSRQFGALVAVDQVNFSLPEKELRAIIGPNGAGKSTFFAMLMGRLRPSSGEIRFRGERIDGAPVHRISHLGISLAFQITNIFKSLSVADNLRIAAQARIPGLYSLRNAQTRDGVEARIETVLEQIDLSSKRAVVAANLSHGEQKYLEIGVALSSQPSLLLLDEPTAGMSIEETLATDALIKKLSSDLSIILVEHDMEVVTRIADKITVFHQGRILAEGTPDEIRANDEVQHVYLRDT